MIAYLNFCHRVGRLGIVSPLSASNSIERCNNGAGP
jgi:hypothetical protein